MRSWPDRQPGESRAILIGTPPDTRVKEAHAFVEARDIRKRYLLVSTVGGAAYRWPLRKAKKLSTGDVFAKLFPNVGSPLDATLVRYEVLERTW